MSSFRRSTLWLVSVFAVLLFSIAGTVVYYLQLEFPETGPERATASNLGFFLLINLNIIVVMILVFLVSKNIITLFLDRKRNILGSRLRSRLVGTFVALSLVPTVLLFLVAKGILESVLQGWFSPQIAASVDGSLALARYHYDEAEAQLARSTEFLTRSVGGFVFERQDELIRSSGDKSAAFPRAFAEGFLREKQEEYGLDQIALVDAKGNVLAEVSGSNISKNGIVLPPANNAALELAFENGVIIRAERSLEEEFLRAYAPVTGQHFGGTKYSNILPAEANRNPKGQRPQYAVVTSRWISPKLGGLLSSVTTAYEDYRELRTYRRPLASSYLLTLIVVTLLIVFAAVWVGFYLARTLSVPIGSLAKATAQVAHGNLDYQIPEFGDDELSVLVRSFNTMTADLKRTTDELVARRRYMETVFANVAVGVIPIDTEFRIAAINLAAAEILSISEPKHAVGRPIDAILPAELTQAVRGMAKKLYESVDKVHEGSLSIEVGSTMKHFQFTVTKLSGEGDRDLGLVLLLDDITELVSAQRMAAWREVARRIAHEIKNPLTPIQLSAQRIQRRFASRSEDDQVESGAKRDQDDRALVADATTMIVEQVDNLRNLVNEFSRFARMPRSSPQPTDLNEVIGAAVAMFRGAHPEIEFELNLDSNLPTMELDPEQMGRALMNLIDNAIAAVRTEGNEDRKPHIALASSFNPQLGLTTLSVSDNGPGVAESDKGKLFEPYFSKKRGGTGLGLAIVSSIVADHQGVIRVRDNTPRGALFTIELPVASSAQKKQANQ